MSTRYDNNFVSFDGDQADASDVRLDPIGQGWQRGTWQDTAKFFGRLGRRFYSFTIVDGGTEDAVDITKSRGNWFINFIVAGSKNVLTLKGESFGNVFDNWLITKPGKVCDVEIGNWYSYGTGPSAQNVFMHWRRADGKPVTYCYRWGCRPKWVNTKTRHLWWRSVGLTAYCAGKYVWHIWLKQEDK